MWVATHLLENTDLKRPGRAKLGVVAMYQGFDSISSKDTETRTYDILIVSRLWPYTAKFHYQLTVAVAFFFPQVAFLQVSHIICSITIQILTRLFKDHCLFFNVVFPVLLVSSTEINKEIERAIDI